MWASPSDRSPLPDLAPDEPPRPRRSTFAFAAGVLLVATIVVADIRLVAQRTSEPPPGPSATQRDAAFCDLVARFISDISSPDTTDESISTSAFEIESRAPLVDDPVLRDIADAIQTAGDEDDYFEAFDRLGDRCRRLVPRFDERIRPRGPTA